MYAAGQESEAFDETLYVRVFTLVCLKQQTRGDLWILLGKLCAHLAQENQFTLIVTKKVVTHIRVLDLSLFVAIESESAMEPWICKAQDHPPAHYPESESRTVLILPARHTARCQAG